MDFMQGKQECVMEQELVERKEVCDHYTKWWWSYETIKIAVAAVVFGAATTALIWLAHFL